MSRLRAIAPLMLLATLIGCAGRSPELATVPEVDLDRFMGDWYVIAHIPAFVECNAYNAIESYERNGDRINTTFTFRNKGFDGPEKQYEPNAIVTDTDSNAVWGMQFLWPFRSDFRIVHLDEDYGTTIIGRNKRDYVWIMAREPELSDEAYEALTKQVAAMGYDLTELRRVPQRWQNSAP
ncbi:MAG: lipocalin family protein [Pseudomonadota bacterium]